MKPGAYIGARYLPLIPSKREREIYLSNVNRATPISIEDVFTFEE